MYVNTNINDQFDIIEMNICINKHVLSGLLGGGNSVQFPGLRLLYKLTESVSIP